jgi:cytochrome c oxidase cbb3-type subunit III
MPNRTAISLLLLVLFASITAHRGAAQPGGQIATPSQSSPPAAAAPQPARSVEEREAAALARRAARRARGSELYAKYCTECHGTKGEGHLADNANSLRSQSFLSTVPSHLLDNAIRYGRPGTAMAAYHQSFGGPLAEADMFPLADYIRTLGDVTPIELQKVARGDPNRGKRVYREHCESCHGPKGKGPKAPSLNDPLFLMTATAPFLRYAIAEGRDGTPMPAFGKTLTAQELDDVTAHVVSWSRSWMKPEPVRLKPTSLSEAVLHPNGPSADLGPLKEEWFVPVDRFKKALDRGTRIIVLDARVPSAWGAGHIPGAVPLPYSEADEKASVLPNDGTWIVAYCECPIALSRRVITTLRAKGFKNTAVLEEGLSGWVARRFPLASGVVDDAIQQPTHVSR